MSEKLQDYITTLEAENARLRERVAELEQHWISKGDCMGVDEERASIVATIENAVYEYGDDNVPGMKLALHLVRQRDHLAPKRSGEGGK